MMVGTTLIQVQPLSAACTQKRAAENFGAMATLPPLASGASIVTAKALMWYSGSTPSTRSWGPRACSAAMACALAARLACVSITPLGLPVVPDVYISSAVEGASGTGVSTSPAGSTSVSGSTSSTGRWGITARTVGAQSAEASTSLQSLWSST